MAVSNKGENDCIWLPNDFSPPAEEVNPVTPLLNMEYFADHNDYLVKNIGINHVCISSDFDGGGGIEGWNDASETINVTIELVRRG
jgi:microsomal dipeptidase-like Zn-dependent dipeptidase